MNAEDRLRRALRGLDEIDPSGTAPSHILRRARVRRRSYALAAALAGAAVILGAVAVAGAALGEGDDGDGSRPAVAVTTTSPHGGGIGVAVSVEPQRVGDLLLEVSRARPAPATDASPWMEHTISIENTGAEAVTIDDTRTSALVGAERLLVADEGCGYGRPSPDGPIEAGACRRYLDRRTILPGGRETWTITLFKELPGMAPLRESDYRFERRLRFRHGDGPWEEHVVRLGYHVDAA